MWAFMSVKEAGGSLKLIVWPLGGFGCDRGQNEKKILGEILKSSVSDLEKYYIPQKNPHKNRNSYMK